MLIGPFLLSYREFEGTEGAISIYAKALNAFFAAGTKPARGLYFTCRTRDLSAALIGRSTGIVWETYKFLKGHCIYVSHIYVYLYMYVLFRHTDIKNILYTYNCSLFSLS